MAIDCPVCGVRMSRGMRACINPRWQAPLELIPDLTLRMGEAWPDSPWASNREEAAGDYPPLTQMPPWLGPRGLMVAASSLNAWVKLDRWWVDKGEPRAIHLDIGGGGGMLAHQHEGDPPAWVQRRR